MAAPMVIAMGQKMRESQYLLPNRETLELAGLVVLGIFLICCCCSMMKKVLWVGILLLLGFGVYWYVSGNADAFFQG